MRQNTNILSYVFSRHFWNIFWRHAKIYSYVPIFVSISWRYHLWDIEKYPFRISRTDIYKIFFNDTKYNVLSYVFCRYLGDIFLRQIKYTVCISLLRYLENIFYETKKNIPFIYISYRYLNDVFHKTNSDIFFYICLLYTSPSPRD